MQQPYGRIVGLHLSILFGGFLMMALHSPMWGLLLLVALKIALDLRGHFAERRKFAGTAKAAWILFQPQPEQPGCRAARFSNRLELNRDLPAVSAVKGESKA